MPDKDDFRAGLGVTLPLRMNLRHERTGGIEDIEPPLFGALHDGARDAMSGKDGHCPSGNLSDIVDKNGAFSAKSLDNSFVVNDFVAHVDRRAELLQRQFDDIDGPYDASAKTPRLSQ
jgi:hypothetical protein